MNRETVCCSYWLPPAVGTAPTPLWEYNTVKSRVRQGRTFESSRSGSIEYEDSRWYSRALLPYYRPNRHGQPVLRVPADHKLFAKRACPAQKRHSLSESAAIHTETEPSRPLAIPANV